MKYFLLVQSVDALVMVQHRTAELGTVSSIEEPSYQDPQLKDEDAMTLFGNRFAYPCCVTDSAPGFCEKIPTFWLHIPKCGTSFYVSVRTCDVDLRGPHLDNLSQQHPPLPSSVGESHVVTILRKPDQRLASAYAYAMEGAFSFRVWGVDDGNMTMLRNKMSQLKERLDTSTGEDKKKVIVRAVADDEFLGKSFQGCQTNMILGRTCMAGTPVDPIGDAKKASAKLDKFRFVGLQEEWALSICLFNYLTSGKRFITKMQLSDVRATSGRGRTDYDTKGYPHDAADEALYAHAAEQFYANLKKHGITVDACPEVS